MQPHVADAPTTAPPLIYMPDGTLRPAQRRVAAPSTRIRVIPSPSAQTAIARMLAKSPLNPWVWTFRAALVTTVAVGLITLAVLVAPSLSPAAASLLASAEATIVSTIPELLLAATTTLGLLASLLFLETVRIGRSYPPLPSERAQAKWLDDLRAAH